MLSPRSTITLATTNMSLKENDSLIETMYDTFLTAIDSKNWLDAQKVIDAAKHSGFTSFAETLKVEYSEAREDELELD